tara:strand:- start:436 stop:759 length:324 start_codon:yes stop_codon:yes gene_type:complete
MSDLTPLKKLKIIKNGKFGNGDDVYQIGYEDAEGNIQLVDFSVMVKGNAEATLSKMLKTAPVEMERARSDTGHFVADDPATPDVNEAYTPKKKPAAKKKAVAKKKKK